MNSRSPAVFLIAVLCFALLSSASDNKNTDIDPLDIGPIDFLPLSPSVIRVNVVFTNKLPVKNGLVTLKTSEKIALVTEGRDWMCNTNLTSCTLAVEVLKQERISFDFRLKEYFDLDYLDIFFSVGNESTGKRAQLSHIQEPGAITVDMLSFAGLVSLVAGGVLWLLILWSLNMPKEARKGAAVAGLARSYLLLLAVLANLLVAFGLSLLVSPTFSITSVTTFAAVFAAGFLVLLAYLPSKAKTRVFSPEEIAVEKKRLRDMVTAAKVKLMRREIDDATYNKIVQECELEFMRFEALEREAAAGKPNKPAPVEKGD